jgi:hypothetical protein
MNRSCRTTCLLIVIFVISACGPSPTPEPLPAREERIPLGAFKVTSARDPCPPLMHSDEWTHPIPLEGAVNTAGAEDSPFILPDGKTLYFFFTPDANVPFAEQAQDGVTGIYVSHKDGDRWGTAERVLLQKPGKLALDGCPFVQGETMWFCSAREGYAGVHHFTAELENGKWQNWQDTGQAFPEVHQVGELHITAGSDELYFHSDRAGGAGGFDLWVSRREGNAWGAPQNIHALNTAETEGWPFVTQDGRELWYTGFHQGTPAIWRSLRTADGWSIPELIVSQFAGEPTLDAESNLYLVHHFYLDGKQIEADIYVAYKKG